MSSIEGSFTTEAAAAPSVGEFDFDFTADEVDAFGTVFDSSDAIPVDPECIDLAAVLRALEAEAAGESVDAQGAGLDPELAPSRAQLIEQFAALHRQLARLQATERRLLAELTRNTLATASTGRGQELALRSLAAELATTIRVSDRTITSRLNTAHQLVTDYPATIDALEAGQITWSHAATIADAGTPINDPAARNRYENLVLERALDTTPGRLRSFARVTAAAVGPVTFQSRHDTANRGRRLTLTTLDDGMSQLTHILPTVLGEAIWDRLTQQAKAMAQSHSGRGGTEPRESSASSVNSASSANSVGSASSHGATAVDTDPRTFDQLRSDLAAELLLSGDPGTDHDSPHRFATGVRAEISITIPALTLLGVDTEPATITGRSPIDLKTATALAADADHWVRVITHPVTGLVLAVDTYRPSEQLKRFLRVRDQHCRFPGCTRTAHRCDIDHTHDWQYGGKTHPGNLACLCRNHHTLKQHGGWKVRQTSPGVLEWTTPTGQPITTRPNPTPRFTEH
jgi:hypothetical protein